ncbi:hypothetical protein MRX96_003964 [Rhipicephalus microplus]
MKPTRNRHLPRLQAQQLPSSRLRRSQGYVYGRRRSWLNRSCKTRTHRWWPSRQIRRWRQAAGHRKLRRSRSRSPAEWPTFGTNNTDLASSSTETGIAAACYALFLRHGLLLLVLAVVCGISCLLGALLPIFCRRRRAQVSQYPPKRRFIPARIFTDPQMMRKFRRREHMVA